MEKLPFLALAAAASFITLAGHQELGADWSSRLPWEWRVNNALVSYVRYLGKAFWPTHLAVYYPHPGAWPLWAVIGSALLLAAVTGWVIWRARRAPYLVTGWLWFLGVLVPMIGIVQAGGQAMADRFAYVPLIGWFVMVVWTAADWFDRQSPRSEARSPKSNPGSTCPPVITDHASRITLHESRRTNRLSALSCAGLAALALGGCLWLTSRQVSYWQNTTTLFEHALQVTRNNACAHYMLGSALLEQGRVEEAMRRWETALQIEPWWANIHGRIAMILCGRGDYAGAIARYRQGLEVDPDQYEVLNNLAWLLATCPDASLRNGPEAVTLAERACQVTRFRRTILVGTLAAAYAEAGRFPEAVATAQKACELASESGEDALLARNRELLQLYQAGKAYHEEEKRPQMDTDGHR